MEPKPTEPRLKRLFLSSKTEKQFQMFKLWQEHGTYSCIPAFESLDNAQLRRGIVDCQSACCTHMCQTLVGMGNHMQVSKMDLVNLKKSRSCFWYFFSCRLNLVIRKIKHRDESLIMVEWLSVTTASFSTAERKWKESKGKHSKTKTHSHIVLMYIKINRNLVRLSYGLRWCNELATCEFTCSIKKLNHKKPCSPIWMPNFFPASFHRILNKKWWNKVLRKA